MTTHINTYFTSGWFTTWNTSYKNMISIWRGTMHIKVCYIHYDKIWHYMSCFSFTIIQAYNENEGGASKPAETRHYKNHQTNSAKTIQIMTVYLLTKHWGLLCIKIFCNQHAADTKSELTKRKRSTLNDQDKPSTRNTNPSILLTNSPSVRIQLVKCKLILKLQQQKLDNTPYVRTTYINTYICLRN